MKRREFFKITAFAGAVAATGLGIDKLSLAGQPPEFLPVQGSGQEIEARIDLKTGQVEPNPNILMRHSACLGCYSSCGNRVKIDKRSGKVLRVSGNPYNPQAAVALPYEAPLTESYLAFSTYKDRGHSSRATLCARGNSTLDAHYDPYRILVPLKRAGKRGDGKWKPISWEQAIQETTEGGALFKELGEEKAVEGFRQVYNVKTPIDPEQPELGPKSNQLVLIGGRGDGRASFAGRFMGAYGSPNNFSHGYT